MTHSHSDALAAAISSHERQLHALAYRLLGDHDLADDAVQDACLRALRALTAFRGDASMTTWLYRITSNVCLDALRRAHPVVSDALVEETSARLVPADLAQKVAERADLGAALAALPPASRRALILTEAWGFDYAETAALLGVPKGTVASRVHRAKASLRVKLGVATGTADDPDALERAA